MRPNKFGYYKYPITDTGMFNAFIGREQRICGSFNKMNSIFTGNHKNKYGERGASSRYLGYSIDDYGQFEAFHFCNFHNVRDIRDGQRFSFMYRECYNDIFPKYDVKNKNVGVYGFIMANRKIDMGCSDLHIEFDSNSGIYEIPDLKKMLSLSGRGNDKIRKIAKEVSIYAVSVSKLSCHQINTNKNNIEMPFMYKAYINEYSGISIGNRSEEYYMRDVVSALFTKLDLGHKWLFVQLDSERK